MWIFHITINGCDDVGLCVAGLIINVVNKQNQIPNIRFWRMKIVIIEPHQNNQHSKQFVASYLLQQGVTDAISFDKFWP